MPIENQNEIEQVISSNKEEWNRLLFLLKNPEGTSVFWINCDTYKIKKLLHDALADYLLKVRPFDIHINEDTLSLKQVVKDSELQITDDTIIHIFGIENAVKNEAFLENLNFQRDSFFGNTPANIIIWGDFATTNILSHKTYDFWSWISLSFDFVTPDFLLTYKQKEQSKLIELTDKIIPLHEKDASDRFRHIKHEWTEFLKSVNGKPSTAKQMADAVIIAMALGKEYKNMDDYNSSISLFKSVLELNPDILSLKDKSEIYNEMAGAYYLKKDNSMAIDLYERSLDIASSFTSVENPGASVIASNMALALIEIGNYERAKNILENAIAADTKYFGEHDFRLAAKFSNLAKVYWKLGDLSSAKVYLEKSIDIASKNGRDDIVSSRESNLAVLYRDIGETDKARRLLEKSLDFHLANFGENSSKTATVYFNLAMVYTDLGDFLSAEKYMKKSHEIREQIFGKDNPATQIANEYLNMILSHLI